MEEKIADIKAYIVALEEEADELDRLNDARIETIKATAHPRQVESDVDYEQKQHREKWIKLRGKTHGLQTALRILTGKVSDRCVKEAIEKYKESIGDNKSNTDETD